MIQQIVPGTTPPLAAAGEPLMDTGMVMFSPPNGGGGPPQ